jgi:hypothetical protein
MKHILPAGVFALGFCSAAPFAWAGNPFAVTYEAPGVETANTTLLCSGSGSCVMGTETFNEQSVSGSPTSFSTNFGTGGLISGTYSGVLVSGPTQYGGENGTGNYANATSSQPYTLSLTSSASVGGIDYFGIWVSAMDVGNVISFYNNGVLVYSFNPTSTFNSILGTCSTTPSAYCGNPSGPYRSADASEHFAYLNFYDTVGSFNEIVFSENPNTGDFESSDQTVGHYSAQSGLSVPEPASIGLLAMGLLGSGILFVRRRSARRAHPGAGGNSPTGA